MSHGVYCFGESLIASFCCDVNVTRDVNFRFSDIFTNVEFCGISCTFSFYVPLYFFCHLFMFLLCTILIINF